MSQKKVLIIYTGGTIGMARDEQTNSLKPLDFKHLVDEVPDLKKLSVEIESYAFKNPIDSSNVNIEFWQNLAKVIEDNYKNYNGFVILHGSDTMAYTASALSFMLENLSKPVVLTGSQLPIGVLRTDGKDNLITSIEIAAHETKGFPTLNEVTVFFEDDLFRGNRTHKHDSSYFEAFTSDNYPSLAKAGITIDFKYKYLRNKQQEGFRVNYNLNNSVQILFLFPGISEHTVKSVLLDSESKAVVIHTYGSGNAPTFPWFLELLNESISQGKIIYNVTQCDSGKVKLGKYETSLEMRKLGVVSGVDITIEAAVTKLMYLLGFGFSKEETKNYLATNLRGEITV